MLKLSIFPNIPNLPKSKEEKIESAKRMIYPTVISIVDENQLIDTVTDFVWSPYIFSGKRNQGNFESSDFVVLDIDTGLTMDEAEKIIVDNDITCLCMPSTSHTESNHRFRLIFPLNKTVIDDESIIATTEKMLELFPMADEACVTDTARAYFSCIKNQGFWYEGKLLEPTIVVANKIEYNISSEKVEITEDIKSYTDRLFKDVSSIPSCVDYFLKNANTGLEGQWIISLNAFVFTLALQKVEYDSILSVVKEIAPYELDRRDIGTINRAYKDGVKASIKE